MKYNLTVMRKLILEAFDEEELTLFCHEYFGEVIERFGSGMGKSAKVLQLVTYCDRREELDTLLEKIRAERPKKYEKYLAQLESGEGAPSVVEEIRAGANEYAEMFESMSTAESHRRRVRAEADSAQGTTHPLAGSQQEVKRWFLMELEPDEQIFVITAALFSGLERQELMGIYKDVVSTLQPVRRQTDKEGQRD